MQMPGRIGELGHEMAKFATLPSMLFTMPSRSRVLAPVFTTASDQFILRDARTILSHKEVHHRPLPPASLPTAISVTRIGQRSAPTLCHLSRTTTITSPCRTGDYTPPSASVVTLDPRCLTALVLVQCALDPYPLPAFLRPPRHLQCLSPARMVFTLAAPSVTAHTREVVEY